MPSTKDKAGQLKSIIELLQSSVTKAEFVEAFQQVLTVVKDLKQSNSQEWSLINSALQVLKKKLREEAESDLDTLKKTFDTQITKALKEQQDGMNFIYDKVARIKEGKDGKDGQSIVGPAGRDGRDGKDGEIKELSPDEIRNSLELLQENERLDKSAIKGIEDIEKDIKEIQIRPAGRVGGAKGVALYIGGSKKLLSAQTLNLVAGTGITLSYSYASGRNDITISASGTVALTPITVTGTIDDSNTAFTAASTPTLVIINGASYRDGHGVTISGTSITTDNPIGTGGDIYCL